MEPGRNRSILGCAVCWVKRIFIQLMVLGMVPCVSGWAQDREIQLASSEYPPYFGEKLDHFGALSEIIAEAYKRVGYRVTIKFYPWARAFEEAKSGRCDGMIALWYRAEREQWFVYSAPLPSTEMGFYKRKADPITFSKLEDLKPFRIGTVRGYANPPGFHQATYLQKEEVMEDIQNLKKLAFHRVDLVLIERRLAAYLLKNSMPEYQTSLEWMEPALLVEPHFLVLSRRSPNYEKKREDFNRGLEQLSREGAISRIRIKHGI